MHKYQSTYSFLNILSGEGELALGVRLVFDDIREGHVEGRRPPAVSVPRKGRIDPAQPRHAADPAVEEAQVVLLPLVGERIEAEGLAGPVGRVDPVLVDGDQPRSDLALLVQQEICGQAAVEVGREIVTPVKGLQVPGAPPADQVVRGGDVQGVVSLDAVAGASKIGRASCRERV